MSAPGKLYVTEGLMAFLAVPLAVLLDSQPRYSCARTPCVDPRPVFDDHLALITLAAGLSLAALLVLLGFFLDRRQRHKSV